MVDQLPRERLLRAEEVAEQLLLHPATVHRLARQGDIPCVMIAGSRRFLASDLDAWLARLWQGGRAGEGAGD